MSPFSLRMLAYDKRDMAIQDRLLARSYLREGATGMHKSYMRKAMKSWIKFRQYMDESKRLGR